MRVLFVSNLYPPNVVGGYERLCFEVASAFARAGHNIAVLTSTYGNNPIITTEPNIHRTLQLLTGATIYEPFAGGDAQRAKINAANVEALHAAVAESRPQIIYSWNLFFLDRSLLDALASFGVPVAVMLTDNWLANMTTPEYVASFFRNHVFGDGSFQVSTSHRSRLMRWLFDRARSLTGSAATDDVLPMTAVYGSEFMRLFYRDAGLRFARAAVIHNGVHQQQIPENVFRDRSKPVVSGELRILFAGRLVDLKGADTVVAALDHLPAAICDSCHVRLTLVGDQQDAVYVARLQATIASYKGHALIDQCPTVPEDRLFELFADHDIYVFPSLYEPFSLTLIHALACGIPTIASNVGGNIEIVKHAVSGLRFAKGDASDLARQIARMAFDPDLRERVSRGGRDAARRFGFSTMIGKTEALFRELHTA